MIHIDRKHIFILILFFCSCFVWGCAGDTPANKTEPAPIIENDRETLTDATPGEEIAEEQKIPEQEELEDEDSFNWEDLPPYSGCPYVEVNGNRPFFTEDDLDREPFESYSDLDELGRCGAAFAMISKALMPEEDRGPIGHIRPSGWHTVKYDFLPDRYLYNRCHLIGYQLAGENDNEKNLITGTRYMNVEGMLPFEDRVANYVRSTGKEVLYRVTPVFRDDNLVADGVLMEAHSTESDKIAFCVFCYNVQPGIAIDYSDGSSEPSESAVTDQEASEKSTEEQAPQDDQYPMQEGQKSRDNRASIPEGTTYVLNTNTRKFHRTDCPSVGDMKPKNTQYFEGDREEAIDAGYSPCGRCNP